MCGVCVLNRKRLPLLELNVVLLELKDEEGEGEGEGEENEVEGEVEVDNMSDRIKVLDPPFRPPIA